MLFTLCLSSLFFTSFALGSMYGLLVDIFAEAGPVCLEESDLFPLLANLMTHDNVDIQVTWSSERVLNFKELVVSLLIIIVPSSMDQVLRSSCLANLIPVLSTNTHAHIKRGIIEVLGTVASHSTKARDFVLSLNVLTPLINLVSGTIPSTEILKTSAWALSVLCKGNPAYALSPPYFCPSFCFFFTNRFVFSLNCLTVFQT